MTGKLLSATPGRRLLAWSLASTLLASGIAFTSSTTAAERSANSGRDRSDAPVRAANTRREANTPRPEPDDDVNSLNWSAPLTREDGSKLYPGEINGYRIYYRKPGDSDFNSITVSNASSTSYELGRFQSGLYEFSVTTLDTDGLESRRSRVISAQLD